MEKLNSPPPVAETEPEPVEPSSNLEFSDDLLKSIGMNNEVDCREEVLSQLETMFGGRVFKYGPYQGTVREIADLCPAFNSVLKQGDVAVAAAWLEANDETSEEEEPKEEFIEDEIQDQEENEDDDKKVEEKADEGVKQQTSEPKLEKVDKKEPKSQPKQEEILEVEAVEPVETKDEDIAISNPIQESKNTTKAPVEIIKQDVREVGEPELASEKAAIAESQNPEKIIATKKAIKSAVILEEETENVASGPDNLPEITADEQLAPEAEIETTPESESIDLEAEETDINLENEAESPMAEAEIIELPILEPIGAAQENESEEIIPEIPEEYFEETEFQDEEPPTLIDMALAIEQEPEPEQEPELEADLDSEAGELVEIINQDQENVFDTSELIPEITEIISELTQEVPKIEQDMEVDPKLEFEPLQIYQQASSVIKKIELLEKARTAEECKEALKDLRIELADLLQKFGYIEYDYLVERLIQNYDVATLKKYMAAMMQKIIKSRKLKTQLNKQIKSLPARKYGSPAVRNVINLTLV